jgi:hypothetical protein
MTTHKCPLCQYEHEPPPAQVTFPPEPAVFIPGTSSGGFGGFSQPALPTVPDVMPQPPVVIPVYLWNENPPTPAVARGIATAFRAGAEWLKPWADGKTFRVGDVRIVQARPLEAYRQRARASAIEDMRAAGLPINHRGYIVAGFRQGIKHTGIIPAYPGEFVGPLGGVPSMQTYEQGAWRAYSGTVVKDGDCVEVWAAREQQTGWWDTDGTPGNPDVNDGMALHEVLHCIMPMVYHPAGPPWIDPPVESGTGWMNFPQCTVHPQSLDDLVASPFIIGGV